MGLPVKRFIAATNENDVFTKYLDSGEFRPKDSKITISNAMDVGDPSNFVRIQNLFDNNYDLISKVIYSKSFNDIETIAKIDDIYRRYNYIIDPHGAVGYLAAENYLSDNSNNVQSVILETAHPSKFMDVFTKNLDFTPNIPDRLAFCLHKNGQSQILSNDYLDFKDYLLS